MRLTTLQKIKDLYQIGINSKGIAVTNTSEDLSLSLSIDAVSAAIETDLKRSLKLQTYTVHFSPTPGQGRFAVHAYPIVTITSIEVDSTGRFQGLEETLDPDTYMVAEDGKTIVLASPAPVGTKSIRVVFDGGLAASPDLTSGTLDTALDLDESDELTVSEGDLIVGQESGARGTYLDNSISEGETTLRLRHVSGVFQDGETIRITSGSGESETTQDRTLTLTAQSLAEVAPDLSLACAIQSYHYHKNKAAFDAQSTDSDSVSRRGPTDGSAFLQEVRLLIGPYQNKALNAKGSK